VEKVKGFKIIPMGGLGEIGKNMMVFEGDGSIFVVDCGLMFPEERMLGIDFVIPDMTYVLERKDMLKGIVVTHGHEDHIGAIPFLLKEVDVPIYGGRLSLEMVRERLKESGIKRASMEVVNPRDVVKIGPFEIEFIRVSHSIPDGFGLGIRSPCGLVVHTGDFKIDHTPPDGIPMDLRRFAELGEEGVLLLLSDSTNVEKEGVTPSEKVVGERIERIIGEAKGRVIIATFASNILRIREVMESAARYRRKVAIVGKAMEENVRIAMDLGYIRPRKDLLIGLNEIRRYPGKRILILTTGSQGEPMSALSQMALGDHRFVRIEKGDTVLISARTIPGNERMVFHLINQLFRMGARVFYEAVSEIHVSGHASREDLKTILSLVRPSFFIPIHGEFRHLVFHADLALEMGMKRERVIIAENGDLIKVSPGSVRKVGKVRAGNVLVDGKGIGDIGDLVLRDRIRLAQDGMVVVIAGVSRSTGEVVVGPEIISKGVTHDEAIFGDKARELVASTINSYRILGEVEGEAVADEVRRKLRSYIAGRTARNPMVIPYIFEV
jgi:ribonuclease J